MVGKTPKHWGSWKGKIIKAIAIAAEGLSWTEIQEKSGLTEEAVYTAIGELLETNDLEYDADEGAFYVKTELYKEYRTYLNLTKGREEKQLTMRVKKHKHTTLKGDMVRSKGEQIIADTLWQFGISYEYEKPLRNPQIFWDHKIPDFTIDWKGKTFYWEHLGLLSKKDYQKKWSKKREWYKRHGVEGQLLVTVDPKGANIKVSKVEEIIRERITTI